jgi:3-oxoacyl-[acyl-carrier protein] reductase
VPTAVHYATSKAAMIGFTKCLSREAGTFGVKVNAIAAGIFDTELAQALPERLLQMHHFWASADGSAVPKNWRSMPRSWSAIATAS